MIDQRDLINSTLALIKRKIFLLIGRAVLTAVTNDKKYQLLQVKGLDGETITNIERFQEYGIETYPKKSDDTEVLLIAPAGNRDQSIAICVFDKRYRPDDLEEGEVCLYTFNDSQRITLKKDGTIRIEDKNGNYIKSTTTQWDINGNFTVDK